MLFGFLWMTISSESVVLRLSARYRAQSPTQRARLLFLVQSPGEAEVLQQVRNALFVGRVARLLTAAGPGAAAGEAGALAVGNLEVLAGNELLLLLLLVVVAVENQRLALRPEVVQVQNVLRETEDFVNGLPADQVRVRLVLAQQVRLFQNVQEESPVQVVEQLQLGAADAVVADGPHQRLQREPLDEHREEYHSRNVQHAQELELLGVLLAQRDEEAQGQADGAAEAGVADDDELFPGDFVADAVEHGPPNGDHQESDDQEQEIEADQLEHVDPVEQGLVVGDEAVLDEDADVGAGHQEEQSLHDEPGEAPDRVQRVETGRAQSGAHVGAEVEPQHDHGEDARHLQADHRGLRQKEGQICRQKAEDDRQLVIFEVFGQKSEDDPREEPDEHAAEGESSEAGQEKADGKLRLEDHFDEHEKKNGGRTVVE